MSEKKVLVPVADGSEDIELACITDVLVRAGATVTVASVMPHIQVEAFPERERGLLQSLRLRGRIGFLHTQVPDECGLESGSWRE